jgi:hypothetical protein
MNTLRSMPPAIARCAQRDGPACSRPLETSQPAEVASMPLRIRVGQPTGAECNWPKQRQSGLRPRAKVTPMPIAKMLSRASAAQAPYQAKPTGTSATATTISPAESNRLKGCASPGGRPKSFRALLDPLRSTSFVRPARKNTAARRSLTANRANPTILGSCPFKYTRRPP